MATEPPALDSKGFEKARVPDNDNDNGNDNDNDREHSGASTPEEDEDIEGGPPLEKIKSVNSISSIPNGGLRAWLVVAGSCFLFFNSWFVCQSSPISFSAVIEQEIRK